MVTPDLWAGADVRYIGPAVERRGVELRPGTRAVVVDAGRHHVTSFGSLYAGKGTRPRPPSRGVVITLADGAEMHVPRRHVELMAPDHPLAPEPDGSAAAWWLDQLVPWGRHGVPVRSLVPEGFPAVAQVLHSWWDEPPPDGQPIRWGELASRQGFDSVEALDRTRDGPYGIPAANEAQLSAFAGELDEVTAATLVEVLSTATATPEDVFVAVWVGWGDVPVQRFPGAAVLDTQSRGHFLLRGPLVGVLTSIAASGMDCPTAGLWWPADRAWFVATEVDFEWTFVAGSQTMVDRLLANPRLEVARTTFDAPANQAAEPA